MNFKKLLYFALTCAALAAGASGQTVIKPGTAIKIQILGIPQDEMSRISAEYPVSAGGTINMPFIGTISAGGSTPTDLAHRIESAYKSAQIYRYPTVQVIASSGQSIEKQIVHIGGHVKRPGPTEFVEGLTIYQAIQAAGGADEFGAMNRVRLTRGGSVKTLNVKQDQFKNYVLQQSDTIEVPEKNIWGQ